MHREESRKTIRAHAVLFWMGELLCASVGSRSNLDALIEVNSWKKAAKPNSQEKRGDALKKQNKKAHHFLNNCV